MGPAIFGQVRALERRSHLRHIETGRRGENLSKSDFPVHSVRLGANIKIKRQLLMELAGRLSNPSFLARIERLLDEMPQS
jgi:hypothetical protein